MGWIYATLYRFGQNPADRVFLLLFGVQVVGCSGNFTMTSREDGCIAEVRNIVGDSKVLVRRTVTDFIQTTVVLKKAVIGKDYKKIDK